MKLKIQMLFLLLTLIPCSVIFSQEYYPDQKWESKKPETLQMDAAMVDSAVALALRSENKVERDLRIANLKAYAREPGYEILGPMKERGGPAGLIIRKGYIVAQWGDVERVDMTFSVTKSYLSAVTGLAVDRGLIRNVDDPVLQYVWDGTFDGEHNGKVTWKHLLQQTSDWSGCLFTTCDWADRPPKEGGLDEWKNRELVEPGTQFEYNDTRVNLLAYSLLQVWRKPLPAILRDYIMNPIGASTTWRWYGYENSYVNVDGLMTQSVSGGEHFGGGLFISAIDHARFGLLFLRKGKWKDQQLISTSWVEQSQKPSVVYPSYGYMWWTNAEHMYPDVPSGIYSANGFGGNYIIVDPEHDLVIVTRWMDNEKIKDVIRLIVESCK